jgi:hypothetical protein
VRRGELNLAPFVDAFHTIKDWFAGTKEVSDENKRLRAGLQRPLSAEEHQKIGREARDAALEQGAREPGGPVTDNEIADAIRSVPTHYADLSGNPAKPAAATPGEPRRELSEVERMRQLFGSAKGHVQKIADDIKVALAPATRGEPAKAMSGILRENLSEMAHKTDIARASLQKAKESLDSLDVRERYAMVHSIETGTETANKALQPIADALREIIDGRRDIVRSLGTGALDAFYENYFPHIWKDPAKAEAAFAQSRRPLEGSKDFLKKRTLDTVADGLAMNLEPVSTNPVEIMLLKILEMDKYTMAHQSFNEWKETGLTKFFRLGEKTPEGWTQFNDKMSRVFAPKEEGGAGPQLVGNYYMPEKAATLVNNYLSPGLQGNAVYDAMRGIGKGHDPLRPTV